MLQAQGNINLNFTQMWYLAFRSKMLLQYLFKNTEIIGGKIRTFVLRLYKLSKHKTCCDHLMCSNSTIRRQSESEFPECHSDQHLM